MSAEALHFTSSIELPDGRSVYVSLDVPADHPTCQTYGDRSENSEIVHMAAARLLNLAERVAERRARLSAETDL